MTTGRDYLTRHLMSSADCILCDSDDEMDEIIVLSSSAVSSEET